MSNARSALRLTCTDYSCISQLISCHSLMFTHAFVTSTFLTIYTYISNSIVHQVNSSQRPLGQSILLMSIINSCVLLIKEFDNIIKSVKSGQEDRESKLVKLHIQVLETHMTSDQNLQISLSQYPCDYICTYL